MARKGDGLYLRGKTWWLDCRINGQRYKIRLGKDISRSVASELASIKRGQILRGEAGIERTRKDLPFEKAREYFEQWASANKKPRTIKTYKECLRRLNEAFKGRRLSNISPFLIEKYKQRRIQNGAKVRANRELATLKALFNRCRDWGKYDGDNPVRAIKPIQEPRQRLRFLDPDEEHRLLAAARNPLRAIIILGIHCGLRLASEALTLRWSDVDLKSGLLTVQAAYAKNGHMRTVPLNTAARETLKQLRAQSKSEFVFAKPSGAPYHSIRNGFESACRTAGLKGVTPHTLRHTFATRLIANGVDLRTVQELGGWSSLRMLERYAHITVHQKAQAVEKLVQEFHTAFHTTPKMTNCKTRVTKRKIRVGEVAEWPKATVC